jgi:predicted nucleic acid-binding protein
MMSVIVLDASVTLTWVFPDEATKATARLQDELTAGAEAWVPALWHLELVNVLLNAHKRGRIDRSGIEMALSRLRTYRITIDDETMTQAWNKTLDLAVQYQLTTYDAAYLELALRRNLPLATLDEALIAAAKAAGVSLCLRAK